jgi:hypothetical protein
MVHRRLGARDQNHIKATAKLSASEETTRYNTPPLNGARDKISSKLRQNFQQSGTTCYNNSHH